MFENCIETKEHLGCSAYADMIEVLNEKYQFRDADRIHDITEYSDFIPLHEITSEFYQKRFTTVYENYVPLYHSLWKMRVQDVLTLRNMHQDGGIHYFSKNGYQSRMITLWTNIYKDIVPDFLNSDLGLFVIDNQSRMHQKLYTRLAAINAHFYQKGEKELADIGQLDSTSVFYDLSRLKKTTFDYFPGKTIQFNSHLLHGSQGVSVLPERLKEEYLNKFRVSLTSVWIHREDLNEKAMQLPKENSEQVYLERFQKKDWSSIRQTKKRFCEREAERIASIKKLAQHHLDSVSVA